MNIALKPVTVKNWRDVAMLRIRDDQRSFVAANVVSIAEAQFYDSWEPKAIYTDDILVGFLMWGLNEEKSEPEWWIIRLMIDAAHQLKGYGKWATLAAIDELKSKGAKSVYLSFEPQNTYARAFYEHLGFADTGRIEEDELVFRLAVR